MLSPVEIANLTRRALRFVSSESPCSLLDLETLDWVNFFDWLRADLRESPDRPAEDRQFLVALSLFGTGQPAHSAVFAGATRPADAERMLSDVDLKLAEPRFDAPGRRAPALPAWLGPPIYLVRLGVVRPRSADAEYLYPVEFTTRITFWSVRECHVELEYESVVGDSGAVPVFRVSAVDDPEKAFEGALPMRYGARSPSQSRTRRGERSSSQCARRAWMWLDSPRQSRLGWSRRCRMRRNVRDIGRKRLGCDTLHSRNREC
jgi:hypothetical protein